MQFASSQILGIQLFFLLGILVSRSLSFSHYIYLYSLCVLLCLVLSKAHPTASARFICFSFVGRPHSLGSWSRPAPSSQDIAWLRSWSVQDLDVRTWAVSRASCENLSSFKSFMGEPELQRFWPQEQTALVCGPASFQFGMQLCTQGLRKLRRRHWKSSPSILLLLLLLRSFI